MKRIGTINLTTGKLTITDPCYDKGTWCTAHIKNVHKGDWDVYVDEVDTGSWGIRIGRLEIRAVGQEQLKYKKLKADIGVDAGLCGIFENKPNYEKYDDGKSKKFKWADLCHEFFLTNNYGIATKENMGCVGCWSSSGYGDGSYIATVAYNKEDEITFVSVDYGIYFEGEEDED